MTARCLRTTSQSSYQPRHPLESAWLMPDEGSVIWGEKSVSLLRMSESHIARAGI